MLRCVCGMWMGGVGDGGLAGSMCGSRTRNSNDRRSDDRQREPLRLPLIAPTEESSYWPRLGCDLVGTPVRAMPLRVALRLCLVCLK